MKTKFYYLMMCLVMALSATALVSCGGSDSDDDEDLPSGPTSSTSKGPKELGGHKIYIDMTYPEYINDKPATYQCVVDFTSNDTFEMYATNKWYEYDFVANRYVQQTDVSSLGYGSYTYDGTRVNLSNGYVFIYENGKWTSPDFKPTADSPFVISYR